jgi:hypothetical protein
VQAYGAKVLVAIPAAWLLHEKVDIDCFLLRVSSSEHKFSDTSKTLQHQRVKAAVSGANPDT